MATLRDMMNAHEVFVKLADNPNVYVTTSFKLLPLLSFLTVTVDKYTQEKESIIAEDISLDEKEQKLNAYLNSEISIPDISVGINTLRGCSLTMVDIQHIRWWLVEVEPDEDFE